MPSPYYDRQKRERLDAFGNPSTPADVPFALGRARSSMPVEPLPPHRVVFRDTDPRPRTEAPDDQFTRPLREFMEVRKPIVEAEDERLIASLAAHLAHNLRGWHEADEIETVIRAWRDGQR